MSELPIGRDFKPKADYDDPDRMYIPLSKRGYCQRCNLCASDFGDGTIKCKRDERVYGQFYAEKCEHYDDGKCVKCGSGEIYCYSSVISKDGESKAFCKECFWPLFHNSMKKAVRPNV